MHCVESNKKNIHGFFLLCASNTSTGKNENRQQKMKEKQRKEKTQELKWICLFFRLTPFIQGERRILNLFNLTNFFSFRFCCCLFSVLSLHFISFGAWKNCLTHCGRKAAIAENRSSISKTSEKELASYDKLSIHRLIASVFKKKIKKN